MKLFLYIELTKWQDVGYEKPLLTYASSLSGDVIGAEMDNQSDASITDLVIKLCDQMQSIFVLIQAQPQEPLGATLKVLNHLLRSKNKIYAVAFSGSNEQAERLMSTLQEKFIREGADKIKDRIKEFALA
ncbi:MAG: hypothetical protein U5K54_19885 [Cytophagales bacterium]|nr:hypothetical protein [Cytophagales bacterium]